MQPDSTILNLMLDVSGASLSPGAPVIQWWSNGGANQKWDFQPMPDGTDEIIDVNSGQCLTTDGIAGDGVYQDPCVGEDNQEWWTNLQPVGFYWIGYQNTPYPIQSVSSGLYLDVNGDSPWPGATIDTWYWNGDANQYFAGYQD
jgi:hypothetical protein